MMPNVVVIAGPNGAGKSTLAPYLLRDAFGIVEYVNADTIAQGLSAFAPEGVAFEAVRIMLRRLNELVEER
jgi:predicted ABC-type ATPase